MGDMQQWDIFRVVGMVVAGLLIFWVASIFLLPLLKMVGGFLWGLAGLASGLLRVALFVALIAGLLYGGASLAGLTR